MYEYFVEKSGFSEKSSIVMLNRHGIDDEKGGKPGNPLPNFKSITVDTEEKAAELRKHFNSFLCDIIRRNRDDRID